MPILPGLDGEAKMSKSLGNQIGVTDPPDEMFGRTMSLPDAAMAVWFELLGIERPDGAGPRDAKRALAGAIADRFHGAGAGAAAAAQLRSRVRRAPGPRRHRGGGRGQPTGRCTCRPCWPNCSASRAPMRGACSARAECASTASRCPPSRSTSSRPCSMARLCSSASAASAGCGWRRRRVRCYLLLSVLGRKNRPERASLRRNPLPDWARRSLKTQQHAHPRPHIGREVSRFDRPVGSAGRPAAKIEPRHRSGAASVRGAQLVKASE